MNLEVDRRYNHKDGGYDIYIQGPDDQRVVARTDDWDRTYSLMRVVRDTISAVEDLLPVKEEEEGWENE